MWNKLRTNLRDRGVTGTLAKAALIASNRLITPVKRRRGSAFVHSRYGVEMYANWNDETFLCCIEGRYGRFLSRHLETQRQPFDFVDIGANQGLYSLIAGRNPACRSVVAVEPVQSTMRMLDMNLERNGVAPKSRVIGAALSERAGTASIVFEAGHTGAASLRDDPPPGEAQTIELVTIDTLDEALPGDLPLHVKVDVEGHEETVIEQLARSRHAGRIEFVFVEIDTRWTNAARIEDLLRKMGLGKFERIGGRSHYDLVANRDRVAS